jgi:pimeloyl-ACP methyl ester carboxylesterase
LTTFLVAHGAWSAGWVWKKMHPLMRAAGHELVTPTYTGLGERGHLANPAIDLDWHIADMLGVLEMEDLSDVVLIGHSYGGMVATGVADRARERIAKLVYLDAFAPKDGDSAFSLLPEPAVARMREITEADGEGWRIPPNPPPPDTPDEDVAWVTPRRLPQPIKTFEQKLELKGGALTLPRSYIYCQRYGPGDVFAQFAERARSEGWQLFEIDASHNPHITVPEALRDILIEIAAA